MYCQKCGSEINEGASFCHNCGTPVVAPEKKMNPSDNALSESNPSFSTSPSSVKTKNKKNKKKGCLIAVIIVIAFFVFLGILGSVIENSSSVLAKGMELNEEQEAAMLTVFDECGIQRIVDVTFEMQNEKLTKYNVRDSETYQFNENKDFDVWINNETKEVEEIDYFWGIVYADGKVENKLPDLYVSMQERDHYWPLATDAVKEYLLNPNTAAFSDADRCRFGIHTGDVFIQGVVYASDSFGKTVTTDYQVTFEKHSDKVIYLRLDGVEYIT